MAAQSIKEKFKSINQDKISEQARKALQLMKEATDNFKDEDAVTKIRPKFESLFDKIKTAKPDAIRGGVKVTAKPATPTQTKSVRTAASQLSLTAKKRISEAKKERKSQGISTSKSDIEKDSEIKAIKKTGRRVSQGLKANQFGSKAANKGKVYYEYRNNRYDKRPDSKPRLERGGMMAKGGKVEHYVIQRDNGEEFVKYDKSVDKYKLTSKPILARVFSSRNEAEKVIDSYDLNEKLEVKLMVAKVTKNHPHGLMDYLEDDEMASGGMMEKGGYVAVTEKDGYWTVISKPTTKKKAEETIKLGGFPRGEVGKVVTVEAAKAHKKIIGKEYLASGGMMAKGGMNENDNMKTLKLYYYKTGGGAEYLMSQKMKGTKDVGDINSKYVVRIDKAKIHGGELIIRGIDEKHDKMASGGMMGHGGETHRLYQKKKVRFDDGGALEHDTYEVRLVSTNPKNMSMDGFNGQPLEYYGSSIGEVFEDVMNSIDDDMEIVSIVKK